MNTHKLSAESVAVLEDIAKKYPQFKDVTTKIVEFAEVDAQASLALSTLLNHMIEAATSIGVPADTVGKCYEEALKVAKGKSREELEFDYVSHTIEITNTRSKVHTSLETLGSILGKFKIATVSKSAFAAMTGEADATEAETDLAQ